MNELVAFFLTVLKAGSLGLGGYGALLIIRQDLILPGLATDDQLVQALAIGRLGSGPNALYLVAFGYLVLGLGGALAALLASLLPPLVMVPAVAAVRRWVLSAPVAGLIRGATLATAGLLVALGLQLLWPGGGPPAVWQALVAAAALAATADGRLHPALVVLGGAVAGVALGR